MTVTVNTNVAAMTTQRYLNKATNELNTSMERLSSGHKINSAKDDAAGLQISNRLTAQSRGLDVAMRNANDGISIAQTAEGAMNEATSVMQRMRDLALQSSNGTNSPAERQAINEESMALIDELNRIAETTSFGGRRLLNGSFGDASFQIGASAGEAMIMALTSIRADDIRMGGVTFFAENGKDQDWGVDPTKAELNITLPGLGKDEDGNVEDLEININAKAGDDIEELATYINGKSEMINASVSEDGKLQIFVAHPNVQGDISISGSLASELGLSDEPFRSSVQDIDMTSVQSSQNAVSVLDAALKYVDSQRADLGAKQNRLSHSINNLANIQENVDASNSRIKDTDFAKETTQMTKAQILQQASTSILAQAKQLPNSAMSLLQ
ncbi:flagellin [Vibrio alginolyticus]|uniref:flagellin n=1 Tax=Vibrio sp. B1FLJ16 TaxID=2751178 RepID=UPI0015F7268F|nr:flagellin [Vibrio sp. B1FLJ16]CAD7801259.1 Flagellin is the subunit protein which polymerizes to form the filaments of bacterial flagella [Vibrio sp. B1FLJ16]CAD7801300.1 Flagellin is the subunit protein which polymerizes to form the filaments of bacterial flagella [Vibrio sp. B1FLJ16]CAE6889682.1 Flagellin is the subunit protein which polymerizes to form the filaments of bacterial flagella [Vibrio sp. B1FLJ16]CAE6890696.1 Flagellin is the subunit protein which polymerizes to form the filame